MTATLPLLRGSRPALTRWSSFRKIPDFSDPTFTYHVPRRIASPNKQVRSISTPSSGNDAAASIHLHQHTTRSRTCQLNTQQSTLSHLTLRHDVSNRSSPQLITVFTHHDNAPSVRYEIFRRAFHASTPQKGVSDRKEDGVTESSQVKERSTSMPSKGQTESSKEHFYDRLQIPKFQRPTKEELLAAATGFWSRLRVRFKWMTIKSMRPYNMDEIFGFFSWILFGHMLWIILGTTTFVSLAILAINSIFAQETLARWIGNYLTKSSGLNVVFESAIVPRWGDGVITFKNVFVSRRPGQNHKSSVTKGSPEAAAVAASLQETISPEDQNYTQFDITLGEVNVTLSFNKWWNSKGLLKNVEIKHVRGVIDRTHVFWTGEPVDPKSYRHEHSAGDFEIDNFKIHDLLVTLHQPSKFRPFPVSIYNAELPRLRKQWLFYDFLAANSMTGEYDHSLFTIHPRQTHSITGADLNSADYHANEPWKKQSRIRVDALNIDHLNRGVEGPFGWINEGSVDIVADILIPSDSDESVMKVMTDFYDQIEAQLVQKKQHFQDLLDSNRNSYSAIDSPTQAAPVLEQTTRKSNIGDETTRRFLVMDLRVHLNDVRATVPLFTSDLSYANNALIRPIVAYINSRRTFIPINCRVVKRVSDFDGSWTIFDSGLMDDLSAEIYEAFVRDVSDEQARLRRFKKVGLWSLQLAVQAIFLGMAGNIA